jgi:hypothetical protein
LAGDLLLCKNKFFQQDQQQRRIHLDFVRRPVFKHLLAQIPAKSD